MMCFIEKAALLLFFLFTICSCSSTPQYDTRSLDEIKEEYSSRFASHKRGDLFQPVSKLNTDAQVIALTFDACGGRGSLSYDAELIEYLRREKIEATLFINSRWIEGHAAVFSELAADPLFEIESHGYRHKPCSIDGASAYGVRGTNSIDEVVDEIEYSARIIEQYSGKRPIYFRSGTACYDEASIAIVQSLGYQVVNFNVISRDYSPYKPAEEIAEHILGAEPGSIVALHMNHPNWYTKEALEIAIPQLRKDGYRFVKLNAYKVVSFHPDEDKQY